MTLILKIMQMTIHPMPLRTQRIKLLEECSGDMFTWFKNNIIKASPEKDHFSVSKKKPSTTVTSDNLKIDTNGVKIEISLEQKLLGVIIGAQPTFKSHTCNMLKKTIKSLMHLQELHPIWTKRKGE